MNIYMYIYIIFYSHPRIYLLILEREERERDLLCPLRAPTWGQTNNVGMWTEPATSGTQDSAPTNWAPGQGCRGKLIIFSLSPFLNHFIYESFILYHSFNQKNILHGKNVMKTQEWFLNILYNQKLSTAKMVIWARISVLGMKRVT